MLNWIYHEMVNFVRKNPDLPEMEIKYRNIMGAVRKLFISMSTYAKVHARNELTGTTDFYMICQLFEKLSDTKA